MDEKQHIQERYYGGLASDYDRKFHRENANHLYKIREIGHTFASHFGERRGLRILEIGAGTGIHAYHLLMKHGQQISKLVLSDLSPEMLAQARIRLETFPQTEYIAHLPSESVWNKLSTGSTSVAQYTIFQILERPSEERNGANFQ